MDGTHLQPGTSSGKGTSFYLHTPSLEYRQFTLAIRFKAESFEGRHSAIISGGPRTRWLHFSQARSGKLQLGLDNHKQRYELTEIQAGKWYDLVCSFNRNAGRVEIYLNGKALEPIGIPKGRGFAVESMDEKDDDKTWAFQNLANATSFKGLIDELVIYDRALAPNDAAQLKLGEL